MHFVLIIASKDTLDFKMITKVQIGIFGNFLKPNTITDFKGQCICTPPNSWNTLDPRNYISPWSFKWIISCAHSIKLDNLYFGETPINLNAGWLNVTSSRLNLSIERSTSTITIIVDSSHHNGKFVRRGKDNSVLLSFPGRFSQDSALTFELLRPNA